MERCNTCGKQFNNQVEMMRHKTANHPPPPVRRRDRIDLDEDEDEFLDAAIGAAQILSEAIDIIGGSGGEGGSNDTGEGGFNGGGGDFSGGGASGEY